MAATTIVKTVRSGDRATMILSLADILSYQMICSGARGSGMGTIPGFQLGRVLSCPLKFNLHSKKKEFTLPGEYDQIDI